MQVDSKRLRRRRQAGARLPLGELATLFVFFSDFGEGGKNVEQHFGVRDRHRQQAHKHADPFAGDADRTR